MYFLILLQFACSPKYFPLCCQATPIRENFICSKLAVQASCDTSNSARQEQTKQRPLQVVIRVPSLPTKSAVTVRRNRYKAMQAFRFRVQFGFHSVLMVEQLPAEGAFLDDDRCSLATLCFWVKLDFSREQQRTSKTACTDARTRYLQAPIPLEMKCQAKLDGI